MADYKTHRYLSDDRDDPKRSELIVTHAPNGDYYLQIAPEGQRTFQGVRFCTSGGCAAENPELLRAIKLVFWALGGWNKEDEAVS